MRISRVAIPFGVAAGLFVLILLLLIRHGLHQDAGIFVYPLDDAYIHMALARNLAFHHVWGITPYAFAGASSSPAWTLLLGAITDVAGVHLLTPLIVNTIAALALLLLVSSLLAHVLPLSGAAYRTLALCMMVLIVPLPGLTLIAMEHVLHSLTVVAMVWLAAVIVSNDDSLHRSTYPAFLLLVASACGALRYDSCFVIVAVAALLVGRRRVVLAIAVSGVSAIGPVLYSFYSYRHSGIFLPFSVVMKSASPNSRSSLLTSEVSPLILLMVIVLLLCLASRVRLPSSSRPAVWSFGFNFMIISIAATVLHAAFGPASWLMRYEAYLFALDLTALTVMIGEYKLFSFRGLARDHQLVLLALLVALLPIGLGIVHRAHHGWSDIGASIHDRYVEHLPQALFVEQFMPHAVVLANDIGFLAYYADEVKILDPLGLGSVEPVLLAHEHREISPEYVANWTAAQHAELAILHTDFPGMDAMIPAGWILVESWCFPHNTVFMNHVQSFYAPDIQSAALLRSKMEQFHALDSEVVRYRFPQAGSVPPSPQRGVFVTCPAIASN